MEHHLATYYIHALSDLNSGCMSTSTMLIYAVDLKKNVKTLSQQQQQHDDLFKFSKKQPVKLMTMLM